jgi:hypothetical protein
MSFGVSRSLPERLAGAGSRVRTDDLLITNQLLYQLSYTGVPSLQDRSNQRGSLCFKLSVLCTFRVNGKAVWNPAMTRLSFSSSA